MLYLVLRILATVSFAHLMRLSQARTRSPMAAAALNYAVAAAGCGAWLWLAGRGAHPQTLLLGSLAGFTYVSSLVLMLPAMRASGVSVTGAILQLSLMAPVPYSIWRFAEVPNSYQAVGILLTLIALPILSASTAVGGAGRIRLSPLVLVLFVSASGSQILMKEFAATRPEVDRPLFSTALFLAATLFTLLWMAATRDTGRTEPVQEGGVLLSEGVLGTVLGLVNVAQLLFLLLALRELPAVIVFPVSASLGVAVNVLASMLVWRERPSPAAWLGIVLAVAAVVLLNLK
ncbi:MAG: hypothetical protein ACK47B_23410 [Armatimonadota bacterium]